MGSLMPNLFSARCMLAAEMQSNAFLQSSAKRKAQPPREHNNAKHTNNKRTTTNGTHESTTNCHRGWPLPSNTQWQLRLPGTHAAQGTWAPRVPRGSSSSFGSSSFCIISTFDDSVLYIYIYTSLGPKFDVSPRTSETQDKYNRPINLKLVR